MKGLTAAFCLATALVNAGCVAHESSNSGPDAEAHGSGTAPRDTEPPGTGGEIRIHRDKDVEEALSVLGNDAWVFKHAGGEVTADFKIFFRPAGADSKSEEVFHASGDDAVAFFRAEQSKNPRAEIDGLIVAALPNGFKSGEGNVVFAFKLGGRSSRVRVPSKEILPKAFPTPRYSGGSGGAREEPAVLRPGESVVLAEKTQYIWTGEKAERPPLEEQDSIRLLLTATAM